MRILLLTKKFPYPLKDGESLAIYNLSRSLHRSGCSLDLLAMNTPKHFYQGKQPLDDLSYFRKIEIVEVDTDVRAKDAFIHLFRSDSYNISRFDSPQFREKLIALLKVETYDVIQLETLYLAPYIETIRQHSSAKVVMRAHNVEHEIWDRIASNAPVSVRKWYLRHLASRLQQYEQQMLDSYDLILPITERDMQQFRAMGYSGGWQHTPIGVDLQDYPTDPSSFDRPLSLSFIGSLDWMPNLEGLKWFLDKSWKQVVREIPGITLHVAGRNTPDWLHRLANRNLQIPGEVADAKAFINQHSLMIVPLLSGSGMRAKILEGMAMGKVVLTTTIGLEGIDAVPGKHVFIADTPEAFVETIKTAHHMSSEKMRKIGQAARALIRAKYSNDQIAQHTLHAFQHTPVGISL
jgi:glycosyltransferase involved in cell wall biosynthesis